MKLFIIRHGDPNYEIDSLTERGWQEAELLSDRLIKEDITKVYVSPLGRAQDTAKPFLRLSGLKAETKDWLREFPLPAFQPMKKYGLAEKDSKCCPWDLDLRLFTMFSKQLSDNEHWFEHEIYTESKAGEYACMVGRELDRLLSENGLDREEYFYKINNNFNENANIAIFCHMGLGSLLVANLAHIAPPLYWQMFRVMPTSVSTITFKKREDGLVQSKIFSVGDTTHLAPIGLTYRG